MTPPTRMNEPKQPQIVEKANAQLALVKDLFELSITQHADAQANFAALDTKAQNTVTIAGAFLAGLLALYNGIPFQTLLQSNSKLLLVLLCVITALLVCSIGACLWAMRIRELPSGDVQVFGEEIDDILKANDEEIHNQYVNFVLGKTKLWNTNSDELRAVNSRKARSAFVGQICLGLTLLTLAFVLGFTLWNTVLKQCST
jgi:hypothetical protein